MAITLTTDFGTQDWFVGTMKGVMADIAPQARVIDLTHEIRPGDIRAAAFRLLASYAHFSPGTIHLVVVDPGVGSARKPIAARTARYFFVGPDNGVLSWALHREGEEVIGIRVLENKAYFLSNVSQTFHGRDIFSPVAASLAAGVPFEDLGPVAQDYVELEWPEPVREGAAWRGEVIYIDRFGNGITNLPNPGRPFPQDTNVQVEGRQSWPVICGDTYSAVPTSTPVLVPGSTGFLEVAVNGGSAEQVLGLQVGSNIRIQALT